MRNFYEFLDISETATEAEITAAFHRWMRLCHPDKAPPAARDQAMTLAKLVEHAYSTLKDAEKRKAYDADLKKWRESKAPPPPPQQPPQQAVSSSIFGDIANNVWKQMTGAATEAIQDAAADAVSRVADKIRKKKGKP